MGSLGATALEVEVSVEQPAWLARQLAIYRRAKEARAAYPEDSAIDDLAEERKGERWERLKDQTRRVRVAARRRV